MRRREFITLAGGAATYAPFEPHHCRALASVILHIHGVPTGDAAVLKMRPIKWYLVVNATKDALKDAKGFKYDRSEMKWIPE